MAGLSPADFERLVQERLSRAEMEKDSLLGPTIFRVFEACRGGE